MDKQREAILAAAAGPAVRDVRESLNDLARVRTPAQMQALHSMNLVKAFMMASRFPAMEHKADDAFANLLEFIMSDLLKLTKEEACQVLKDAEKVDNFIFGSAASIVAELRAQGKL